MIIADTFDPKASGTVDWKSVPVELLAAEAAGGDKEAIAEVARRTGFGKRPRPALNAAPRAQEAKSLDAPAEEKAPALPHLSDLVTHTYAASAPEQARWRSSVAHAVDATYGDPDPDVVVKSTRSLIDTVYRSGSEDLAAAEGETEGGAEDVGEAGAGRDAS